MKLSSVSLVRSRFRDWAQEVISSPLSASFAAVFWRSISWVIGYVRSSVIPDCWDWLVDCSWLP
jgi:hypothetical protein